MGKGGFYEGFEWTLKQHRYFTDISQLKVQVTCSSKALFVDTHAAIFLFPVLPSQQDRSRPAYVYGNKKLSYCCESRSYWLQKYDRLKQLLRDTLSVLTPYSCFHFRLDDQTNHTQPTSRRRAPAKRYSSPPTPPYFYVRFHRDEQTNHAQPTSLGKRGF